MSATRKLKKGECKDIESIAIQFENCEVFEFKREDIANVFFHNIRKNISVCLNAVIEDYEAEDIWLVIKKEAAERKEKVFGFGEEQSFIDRLGLSDGKQMRDITHFYIKYNTGEEETVTCVWIGDSDFDNPAQVNGIETEYDEEFVTVSISEANVKYPCEKEGEENGALGNE